MTEFWAIGLVRRRRLAPSVRSQPGWQRRRNSRAPLVIDWTGVSQLSPFATIAGTRGVNDRTATNVVQIEFPARSVTHPTGSMPAFASAYSDTEIAAVANYVPHV